MGQCTYEPEKLRWCPQRQLAQVTDSTQVLCMENKSTYIVRSGLEGGRTYRGWLFPVCLSALARWSAALIATSTFTILNIMQRRCTQNPSFSCWIYVYVLCHLWQSWKITHTVQGPPQARQLYLHHLGDIEIEIYSKGSLNTFESMLERNHIKVQCDAIITQSIFLKILIIETP